MITQNKNRSAIIFAVAFTVLAVSLGYIALGVLTAFIFTFGYLGGLIIWLFVSTKVPFKQIARPYFIALALFMAHKYEERKMNFFPALSEITGLPVPEITSVPAIMLLALAVVWLAIPFLIWKKYDIGYFLAWTFFASMGITELAHFVLPFLTDKPYGYFPGMYSVVVLAPVAWWGMYRLAKGSNA